MSAVSDPSAPENVNPEPKPAAAMQSGSVPLGKFSPARLDFRWQWFGLFFLVTGILFCRQPGAILHPSLYAEDGVIFFKQQYEQGFLSALFTRYSGYLHFTPRIVAAICALLPLECQPVAYVIASLLIAAAVLTFFFAPGFRSVIASDLLRAGVVLVFTVMPNAEPLLKLAYVNWYMLFFLALVTLFTLPQRPVVRWLFFLPVVVAAWSTPVAIVCLPLILVRAWDAADRRERLWWTALALALIGFPLAADHPPSAVAVLLQEPGWKLALVHAVGYRVFCSFFLGETLTYPSPNVGWKIVTLCSLVLAGVCGGGAAWAFARRPAPGTIRRVPLVLFYLILGLPAMFVLRREWWQLFLIWNTDSWSPSGRYFFCSTLLLCVLCGVIYERVLRNWIIASSRRRTLIALLFLGWLSLHEPTFRLWDWHTRTPWRDYARTIRAAEARVQQTGGSETVKVHSMARGFDFDLVITPASAKRDHAPSLPN